VVLSIIATLISSVALIGVAIGLLLQARQLRASQLQASRSLQAELVKLVIEDPSIETVIDSTTDPADLPKAAFLNLFIMFLRTSYELKAISKASVSFQAQRIFAVEYPRSWWTLTRDTYMKIEAVTKREKEFAALIDSKFQDAIRSLKSPP
jgi:hypothetical protein